MDPDVVAELGVPGEVGLGRRDGHLAGHEGADGVALQGHRAVVDSYPALQFDRDGSPTPGLGPLARYLSPQLADIEIASFCTRPLKALGGKSPIDWLRAGQPIEIAARAAFAD